MALALAAEEQGFEILTYEMYFDRVTRNKGESREPIRARTKINLTRGYLIADAIFMIQTKDGQKELYCLEQINGFEVKKVAGQLKRSMERWHLERFRKNTAFQKPIACWWYLSRRNTGGE